MANQIYCKHCGKLIDADSSFCMHCGGEINSNSKSALQTNKQDISFIRQLDILGGKFLIGIINIIKWCGRALLNIGKFLKPYWKRILIFILGIAGAIVLIGLGSCCWDGDYRIIFMIPAIPLIILTLYFSCSKSIKLILPSSILLLCSYGTFIYIEYNRIYDVNTTFLDTVKREFSLVTPNYIIPDHATSIGERAFSWCSNLKSVTIPNSVNSIGKSAFCGCYGELIINSKTLVEKDYTSDDYPEKGYLYGEGWLSGSHFTKLTIGDNITKIGKYAFYNCSSLTSVTIGNGVTSIGDSAFKDCFGLTSITIPDSVTSIGDSAFKGCFDLTSITIPDSVTWIGHEAFYNCSSLTSVYCKATTPPTGGYGVFSEYDYPCGSEHIGCKIYVPRNSVKAYKSAKYWKEYADDIVGYDF